MATPDDIESRLSAVEREVAQLREQTGLSSTDASAARTLAAGADRDVSEVRAELRAHTSALNALRQSQVDMSHELDGFGQKLIGLEQTVTDRFTSVEAELNDLEQTMTDRFTSVEAELNDLEQTVTDRFTTVDAGLTQIVGLLEERDR